MAAPDPYARPGRTVDLVGRHAMPELGPLFRMNISRVTYEPGVSFPPHIHTHSTYNTVLSGEITIAVDPPDSPGTSERVYRAGESWIEPAGHVHRVTRNDGKTNAVWLVHAVIEEGTVAFFVPGDPVPSKL
ncbi:RmlC-like cupin domain-containing protein [Hyaloraphidium curvatum]|nr:RmlC-like cupin domain-containing protein [Hyaloraphidium curvatum]